MSFEQDPRKGPRPVVQRRRRGALAPTLAILGVLIVLALVFSQVWTDVLWFRQLGYLSVYRTEILTRIALFVVGGLVMAAAVLASMVVGYRSRPVYAPVSQEQASLDRYRELDRAAAPAGDVGVPAALGLFAGLGRRQEWQAVLLWLNRAPFGTKDAAVPPRRRVLRVHPAVVAVRGRRSSPRWSSSRASPALVTHYLYGGLRLQGGGPRMTTAARIHLGSVAAAFLVLRGLDSGWTGTP